MQNHPVRHENFSALKRLPASWLKYLRKLEPDPASPTRYLPIIRFGVGARKGARRSYESCFSRWLEFDSAEADVLLDDKHTDKRARMEELSDKGEDEAAFQLFAWVVKPLKKKAVGR